MAACNRRAGGGSLRAFPFGENLAVLSPDRDSMLVLNSSARLIWEYLSEGQDLDCLVDEISLHFGVPREKAVKDVESVFQASLGKGFLTAGEGGRNPEKRAARRDLPSRSLKQVGQPVVEKAYRLSDVPFRIRFYAAEIAAIFRLVLGHLEVPLSPHIETVFEVSAEDSCYVLTKDGDEIGRESSPNALRHLLVFEIAKVSYPRMDWLIFMHAGAIADGQRCIVFPGVPGCGKSTLVAALIHAGFRYVAEDLVPVSREFGVVPVPARLCIRNGGWLALLREFPEIQALPDSGRENGSKYVTPPPCAEILPPHLPVHCLVFPDYSPGRALEISSISSEYALARLVQTGSWFEKNMDDSAVEALLHWIQVTPAYQLCYAALGDAVTAVRSLLRQ